MMRLGRRSTILTCATLFILGSLPTFAASDGKHSRKAALFSASDYQDRISHLASNDLEGRGTGQAGNDVAAEFIASVYKQYGLRPAGDDGTFFQDFTLQLKSQIGSGTRLTIGTHGRRTRRPAGLHKDFVPLPFSSSEGFKGEVVFVGYGIVNDEQDYNDYEDIDVTDKIVLLLRRGPTFGDFGIRDQSFRSKASRANAREAAAILIVNQDDSEDETLYEFGSGARGAGFGPRSYGIPILHITPQTANRMLAAADMPDIRDLQQKIEKKQAPVSALLRGVTVRGVVQIDRIDSPVRNVVGMIPGTGPQSDEIIVLGAHYDHLGIRHKGEPDFDPDKDISNGADDNASGTTLLMTLANVFTRGTPPNRSLLLIAFTGEELGLLGSRHFVKNPTVDLDKCVAMLNFDMVGRLKNDRLEIGGMRTGNFEDMINGLGDEYYLKIQDGGGGRGPSDHTSFYGVDIPVLFFFTGLHRQYHRPTDDFDLINIPGAIRIARFAADIIDEIDAQSERPEFQSDTRRTVIARQSDEEQDEEQDAAPTPKRVRLGITPQRDDEPGLLVAGVSDDSPAARAGFKVGDHIIKIGDTKVANFDDATGALRQFKDGDQTVIVVRRGDGSLKLEVQFGEPRRRIADAGKTLKRPVKRVQLGVTPDPDDDQGGVLVADVSDDSPAARAGVKAGDRIVRIGKRRIKTIEHAIVALSGYKQGDRTTLRVLRDSKKIKLRVRFGEPPPTIEADDELNDLVERITKAIDEATQDSKNRFRITVDTNIKRGLNRDGSAKITIKIKAVKKERASRRTRRASAVKTKSQKANPHGVLDDDADMPSMPPVRLGIMPAYGASEGDGEGYEITGVVKGAAAEKAGMRDNDRIYKIGKHKITDVYSYMEALRSYKPGEMIPVVVIRDGEKINLKVKAMAQKSIEAA